MTEPAPAPESPFAPSSEPTTPAGGGCGKPLILGCGLLLVLVGVAAVLFVLKLPTIVAWAFHRMEDQIVRQLPDDVTPADRERLKQAFEDAAAALREGEVAPAAAERVQSKLLEVARKKPSEIDRQDILQLSEALEEMAGKGAKGREEKPPVGEEQGGGGSGGGGPPEGAAANPP